MDFTAPLIGKIHYSACVFLPISWTREVQMKKTAALLCALSLFISCKPEVEETPVSGTVSADYLVGRQTIEGFGACNAWKSLPDDETVSDEIVELLFSRTAGMGLSILRTRIPFRENPGDYQDGFFSPNEDDTYNYTVSGEAVFDWDTWEVNNTRELIEAISDLGSDGPEDLTVMATPWTPVNAWKIWVPDAELPAYGGYIDSTKYAEYADVLADFANQYAANMGEDLDVLSVQNEPNYIPTSYESCGWFASQISDFLKVLGPRFSAKGVSDDLRIMAAEPMNFEEDMVLPALADSEASAVLDIVGVHQYDHDEEDNMAAKPLSTVSASGKALWETEVSDGETNDPSITDGIYWAKLVHLDLTDAEVNAFLYWWLWGNPNTKSPLLGLREDNTLLYNKRVYTIGQFSRFIRPGWQRVYGNTKTGDGVYCSFYKDPDDTQFAAVIVNSQGNSFDLELSVSGISGFSALSAWRTSADENIEQIEDPSADGTVISITLPESSVTTVTGTIE